MYECQEWTRVYVTNVSRLLYILSYFWTKIHLCHTFIELFV